MELRANIRNNAGARMGSGPITTISSVEIARKLDDAGDFNVQMAASDPHAALVVSKRCVDLVLRVSGQGEILLGQGIIDSIPTAVAGAEMPSLKFSGKGMLSELTGRCMRGLALRNPADGSPVTDGLTRILALAPPGWSLDTVNGYSTTIQGIYQEFGGESVLAAFNKVAELSGEHFRAGIGRQIVWLGKDRPSSGLRAVQAPPDRSRFAPKTLLIKSISRTYESADLVNRVYAFGGGNSGARQTFYGTTRVPPEGWTLVATGDDPYGYYLEATARRDASESGLIEREQAFPDVNNASNGGAVLDPVSAANALYDAAFAWLDAASQPHRVYKLDLVIPSIDCWPQPGTTIRVIYRDDDNCLNINEDLLIMSSTLRISSRGEMTVGLEVSTVDRLPQDSVGLMLKSVNQVRSLMGRYQPAVHATTATRAASATNATNATNAETALTALSATASNVRAGNFPMSASSSKTVYDDAVTADSTIIISPKNSSAAALWGSAACLAFSAQADGSFTVVTGDGSTALGTEIFNYSVHN